MRRTLSGVLLRRIALFDLSRPTNASVTLGRVGVLSLHFNRKSTTDRSAMDLSSMRKKYKGDEEVSDMQGLCDSAPGLQTRLCSCEVMVIVHLVKKKSFSACLCFLYITSIF